MEERSIYFSGIERTSSDEKFKAFPGRCCPTISTIQSHARLVAQSINKENEGELHLTISANSFGALRAFAVLGSGAISETIFKKIKDITHTLSIA